MLCPDSALTLTLHALRIGIYMSALLVDPYSIISVSTRAFVTPYIDILTPTASRQVDHTIESDLSVPNPRGLAARLLHSEIALYT